MLARNNFEDYAFETKYILDSVVKMQCKTTFGWRRSIMFVIIYASYNCWNFISSGKLSVFLLYFHNEIYSTAFSFFAIIISLNVK